MTETPPTPTITEGETRGHSSNLVLSQVVERTPSLEGGAATPDWGKACPGHALQGLIPFQVEGQVSWGCGECKGGKARGG